MRYAVSLYPTVLLAAGLGFVANSATGIAQSRALEPAQTDIAAPLVEPFAATATAALAALVTIVCMGAISKQSSGDGESSAAMAGARPMPPVPSVAKLAATR